MRFSTFVLVACATSSTLAVTSICDKYTTALLGDNTGANQYTLLTLLVNTALIGNYTGTGSANPSLPGSLVNVPGVLAPANINGEGISVAKYFDGSLLSTNVRGKATSINFLDGGGAAPIIQSPTSSGTAGSAQSKLFNHLYQYFGALLGCSQYGTSNFPAYSGVVSQGDVHRFMVLDTAEFKYFVTQVSLAALSFGVAATDGQAFYSALNAAFGSRCAPATQILPSTDGGAVVSPNSKEPQSICQASDCPLAHNSDCNLYPTEPEPQKAGGSAHSSTNPGSSTSSPGTTPTRAGSGNSASNSASSTGSPTPTASSTVSDTGLSTGAKAGIGVGVALGVVIIIVVVVFFFLARRRKARNAPSQQPDMATKCEDEKASKTHEKDSNALYELSSANAAAELPGKYNVSELPGSQPGDGLANSAQPHVLDSTTERA